MTSSVNLTLCGSARFESEFHSWNEKLTLAGHVVYSLAVFPSQKTGNPADHEWYTPDQKLMLDKVHKRKIKNSDGIVVLNVGGYLGDSTRSEVEYAKERQLDIYWLDPDHLLGSDGADLSAWLLAERKRYRRNVADLLPAE